MTTNLALLGGGVFAQSAYSDALSKPSNKHINLHTIWSRSETSAKKMLAAITDKGLAAPRILFGEQGLQQVSWYFHLQLLYDATNPHLSTIKAICPNILDLDILDDV